VLGSNPLERANVGKKDAIILVKVTFNVTVQLGMKKCQILPKNARLPTNTALICANSGI
jgi:hypothetical protein